MGVHLRIAQSTGPAAQQHIADSRGICLHTSSPGQGCITCSWTRCMTACAGPHTGLETCRTHAFRRRPVAELFSTRRRSPRAATAAAAPALQLCGGPHASRRSHDGRRPATARRQEANRVLCDAGLAGRRDHGVLCCSAVYSYRAQHAESGSLDTRTVGLESNSLHTALQGFNSGLHAVQQLVGMNYDAAHAMVVADSRGRSPEYHHARPAWTEERPHSWTCRCTGDAADRAAPWRCAVQHTETSTAPST